MLGISKRGELLRTLLIHGARAVIRYAGNKEISNNWLEKILTRHNKNVVAVVLANKNVRIVWSLLTKGTSFESDFMPG